MGILRAMAMAVAAAWLALGAAAARAETRIGILDIFEVMNGYERTKDASADLQVEQNKLKTDAEVKKKRLDDLCLKRDAFNKGSEEYKKLDDEALQVEMEMRTWMAVEGAKAERKYMDVMLEMYGQIRKGVARVAKEKGLDIVFTRSFLEAPQIDLAAATGLEDLKSRIVGQRLLYPAETSDVTKDVLKLLNDEYAAAKKRPPGGAAQPPAGGEEKKPPDAQPKPEPGDEKRTPAGPESKGTEPPKTGAEPKNPGDPKSGEEPKDGREPKSSLWPKPKN